MPALPPHHSPLKALCPVDFDALPQDETLKSSLEETFAQAQTIIDSIPIPSPVKAAAAPGGGRARSHTDSAVPVSEISRSLSRRQSATSMSYAQELCKEWKEVKVNAKENPLGINVYKLAAKDGKGAWFARRSVHDGLTFEKWKLGLEREFAESMKTQTGPGSGSIRGIGAERRVAHMKVDGAGKLEVFQLSAQFPGPTTPRDFVTLLLTSDTTDLTDGKRPLRQFMVVSKPCNHPETPPRQGYIRGHYESVEIIREVPSEKPVMKRSRSSIDLGMDGERNAQCAAEQLGREAILRAARKAANGDAASEKQVGRERGKSASSAPVDGEMLEKNAEGWTVDENEVALPAIEWIMITRSDPGGSVPRFMIEKGTPPGIVNDAGKFLRWVTSKDVADFTSSDDNDFKQEAFVAEERKRQSQELPRNPTANLVPDTPASTDINEVPSSTGLYGVISGAFGAATTMASKLPMPSFGGTNSTSSAPEPESLLEEDDDATLTDTSSLHSFASAVEDHESRTSIAIAEGDVLIAPSTFNADDDELSLKSTTSVQHEKEMKKLQDRRRKLQERVAKMQERMATKRGEGKDKERDEKELARLKERHERDIAKQEEKYHRELKRLEEKRKAEERKAQERRQKQVEREERQNLTLELERVKTEKDLAENQIEILKSQVGELQAQNTMLVAKLGRLGALTGKGMGVGKGKGVDDGPWMGRGVSEKVQEISS